MPASIGRPPGETLHTAAPRLFRQLRKSPKMPDAFWAGRSVKTASRKCGFHPEAASLRCGVSIRPFLYRVCAFCRHDAPEAVTGSATIFSPHGRRHTRRSVPAPDKNRVFLVHGFYRVLNGNASGISVNHEAAGKTVRSRRVS